MKSIFINGPINCVRLEGEIFGIRKVIYLFLDVHVSVEGQTECLSVDSQELTHYITSMISGSKKPIDIFFEITRFDIEEKFISSFRKIYIERFGKYFISNLYKSKSTDIDKDKNKKKTKNKNVSENLTDSEGHSESESQSKSRNNDTSIKSPPVVRYHYIDIRDILKTKVNRVIELLAAQLNFHYGINEEILSKIVEYLSILHYNLYKIFEIISTKVKGIMRHKVSRDQNKPSKESNKLYDFLKLSDDELVVVSKFIDKILKKYKHPEIIKSFNEFIEKIIDNFGSIFDFIVKMVKLCEVNHDELLKSPFILNRVEVAGLKYYSYSGSSLLLSDFKYEITKLFEYTDIFCIYTFVLITDLFFLRRFLDKDYVTNAIAYTGGQHSLNYIFVLVKYFNFDITHVSYIHPDYNLETVSDKIKHMDLFSDNYDIGKMFFPKTLFQCSDLTLFPKNFE